MSRKKKAAIGNNNKNDRRKVNQGNQNQAAKGNNSASSKSNQGNQNQAANGNHFNRDNQRNHGHRNDYNRDNFGRSHFQPNNRPRNCDNYNNSSQRNSRRGHNIPQFRGTQVRWSYHDAQSFPEGNNNLIGPPNHYPHAHQIFNEDTFGELDQNTSQIAETDQNTSQFAETDENTLQIAETDQNTSQIAETNISLNAETPAVQPEPEESSSSSASDTESEDSAVQSLRKAVDNSLLAQEAKPLNEKPKEAEVKTTANTDGKTMKTKEENANKPIVKKENPPTSSSDSSTSSSSSSSDSSSDEETAKSEKPKDSSEDVICLGQLERIEDLLEDEEEEPISKCALCDKTGHISFHCQMVCKNCNGKYHGLKDCPKPANLNIVFSNFLQFCVKQSLKYNPNAELTLAENMPPMPTSVTSISRKAEDRNRSKRKNKTRSSETSGSSSRKRQASTDSSDSSDSSSSDISSRRKRRRSGKSEDRQTNRIPKFAVPYAPAFNPAFGFGPSGAVNPMLAFSHMMGFNPASLEFRSNSIVKD